MLVVSAKSNIPAVVSIGTDGLMGSSGKRQHGFLFLEEDNQVNDLEGPKNRSNYLKFNSDYVQSSPLP